MPSSTRARSRPKPRWLDSSVCSPSPGDILLFAVSARQRLAWRSFREVLEQIFVPDNRVGANLRQAQSAIAAIGSLLGHWEIIPEDGSASLSIAPPTLALLPRPGLPTAVLCGARSPDTIGALSRAAAAAGVSVRHLAQDQSHRYAPARIEVTADSRDRIGRLAESLHLFYQPQPAAASLAIRCGSLEEYRASLSWTTQADFDWPRRDFDPDSLRFIPHRGGSSENQVVLSTYEHPSGWTRQDRLWHGGRSALTRRDWARFLVLADRRVTVLTYDHSTGTFTVPRQLPLPSIPARALGLCSGRPPRFEPGLGLGTYVFTDVPAPVAEIVAAKLGQAPANSKEKGT